MALAIDHALQRPSRLQAINRRLNEAAPPGFRPSRLILVNYWLFDYEVFEFAQGRLILRGANGAGKSTVLVSAITLALDGEKRRERLDTFGGQGRGAAYYLLGEPDATPESDFHHTDRTGYVAIEFVDAQTQRALTIGVGLFATRARIDLAVDSWGFVISDGRRIGVDFELFDDNRVPLTQRRLEERLGTGGTVAARAADYQALVNRHLFGFQADDEYRFLLDLLLQLRSPKLNKDTKPSTICELLARSLPPLPMQLLERITRIIDDIDHCIESLEESERRLAAASAIDERQATYFNQLAQFAAVRVLEAERERAHRQSEHERAEAAVVETRSRLAEVERRLGEVLSERDTVRGQIEGLQQSEFFQDQRQLATLRDDLERASAQRERAQAALTDSRRRVERAQADERRVREQWSSLYAELQSEAGALGGLATEAAWPLAEEQAASAIAAARTLALDDGRDLAGALPVPLVREAAAERRAQIEAARRARVAVDAAQREYDALKRSVDEATGELTAADGAAQRASERLDQARAEAVAVVLAWCEKAPGFPPEAFDLEAAAAPIVHYPERDDAGGRALAPLVRPFADAAQPLLTAWRDDERRQVRARDKLAGERDRLQAELDAWTAQEDPVPPRRPGQEEARRRLAEAGTAAWPLYAACEFIDDVEPATAAAIEVALEESGLLDALVVPPDAIGDVAALLREAGLGDLWLDPRGVGLALAQKEAAAVREVENEVQHARPVESSLLTVLRPALPEAAAAVRAALSCIRFATGNGPVDAGDASDGRVEVDSARSEYGAGDMTAIGPSGWRLSLLTATVAPPAASRVRYIGEANRRRFRELKIAELKSQIEAVDAQIWEADDRLDAVRKRLLALERELERLRAHPVWEELQQAAFTLAQARAWAAKRREALNALEGKAAAAFRALGDARAALQEALAPLPEARGRNAEGLRELLEALERFIDRFVALQRGARQTAQLRAAFARAREEIAHAEQRSDSDAQALQAAEQQERQLRARVEAIEAHLAAFGGEVEALMQKLAQLRERATALDAEERRLLPQRGRYAALAETAAGEAAQARIALDRATEHAIARRNAFIERLAAYPTMQTLHRQASGADDGAQEAATEILKLRRSEPGQLADAVERSRSEALQQLSAAFQEHQSTLIDYRPALEEGVVSFRPHGSPMPAYQLRRELEAETLRNRQVLRERESELYEDVILRDVARQIREYIALAESWRDRVNSHLEAQQLSNGEVLSITWRPLPPDRVRGVDLGRVIALLRRDVATLTDAEVHELVEHFRRQVGDVRDRYRANQLVDTTFADALSEVLDYRSWFSFGLHTRPPGETHRELTDQRFATRSGAEKSLAMFVPILVAVHARFGGAGASAPKLIGLDEAFAGVDDRNTREMFRFLVQLDFSWIMTSEKLWGEGDALPACSTYELIRRSGIVTPIWFLWDGTSLHDELSA